MVFVGVLLMSSLALVAVESVGYIRGGYDSAFWRLSLDDKLDHVSRHRWEWWWISVWELVGVFFLTGGLFGLVFMLADEGEPVLAYVALGGYTFAMAAWVLGLTLQTSGLSVAASQRAETGNTPAWVHPLWQSGYLTEGIWIIATNLSYALIGLGILQSGMTADWAGWVSLIGGVLISAGVIITRNGFPQLGILIPAVLGIAVLIEGL